MIVVSNGWRLLSSFQIVFPSGEKRYLLIKVIKKRDIQEESIRKVF